MSEDTKTEAAQAIEVAEPSKLRRDGLPRGRPFQKGVSGNPGGKNKIKLRLRLKTFSEDFFHALRRDLNLPPCAECTAAQKLYAAYTWGLPPKKLEISGQDGEKLQVCLNIAPAQPPIP